MGIIYIATNKINGKYYIGKTTRTFDIRKKEHEYDAKKQKYHFQRAIYRYGMNGFIWEILEDNILNEDILRELEITYITELSANNSNLGYNMTSGGEGGDLISNHPNRDDIIKKMSNAKKGSKSNMYGIKKSKNIIALVRKNQPNCKPILINNKYFQSILDASRKLNEKRSIITWRLKSSNFPEYKYINKQDQLTLYINKKTHKRKILINDSEYLSISEASRKLNEKRSIIAWKVTSDKFNNYTYL